MRMVQIVVLPLASATAIAGPADRALRDSLRSYTAIRQFVSRSGNQLWSGLGTAPFDILLVQDHEERLYCRRSLPEGFSAAGKDMVTGCPSGTRPRSGLPGSLLAAMPMFGAPSTIVMGSAAATGRSDADWTRTILHEHFHQWQDALPSFYARIAALDLSGGDQTGMWMLNFPFPYSDPATVTAFAKASRALGKALDARGTPNFRKALGRYLIERRNLAKTVGSRNWRYAEFELWKEGVARWTEIRLGKRYPDKGVRQSALNLERQTRAWLDKPDIAGSGREFVYPYGAAEAMLLESCGGGWRRKYPSSLSLGPILERAMRSCRI